MCINHIYSALDAEGEKITWRKKDICADPLCNEFTDFRHPEPRRERSGSRGPSYSHVQFPPTPPLSYYSDYTSDSERSSRRRSGVYANEHKVLEINGTRQPRHERQHSGERNSYLGSSPLSRTIYHSNRASSPAVDKYDTYEPEYRSRPSSSHSGPHVSVKIVNETPEGHRRRGSSSKTSSRDSNGEERRHRRVSLQHGDQQLLSKSREKEIARQNQAIKDRTPVPAPTASGYRRGSVSVNTIPAAERLRLEEEKQERRRRRAEKEEKKRQEDAQQQRLKDRFTPRPNSYVSYTGRPEYYP